VIASGALLIYLLSTASSNSPAFAGGLVWLLGAGVAVVLILMMLAGYQLLLLRRRLQQRVFGSKLTLRLVSLFALVAMLPGALVYAVSVQFLTRSIDTWFDIRVETALEGGLSLGRRTLEVMQRELRDKAETMALSLSDQPLARQRTSIHSLREQAAVHEAAVFDLNGNVRVFSAASKTSLAPRIPTGEMLQGLRRQQAYARVVAEPSGSLVARVLVPLNTASNEVQGLQLVQIVPEDISRDPDAVQHAYGEFQELMYSRPGLKRLYGLSLTLALLLALFSSLLIGILFSERLSAPLGVLAEGTRAVAQGDFRERTPVKSYDELRILTRSFNAMTRDLAEAQAASQRYQLELETAKGSLEGILSNLSAGVLALDADGRPRSANPSAGRILDVNFDELEQVPLDHWPDVHSKLAAIAEPLAQMLALPGRRVQEREIQFPSARGELTLLVKVSEIAHSTESGFVVVFDDITNLLRAQRQAAWGEVARRLAHEIKNPLTPIQLSAERLKRHFSDAPSGARALVEECTGTIIGEVESLKGLVDEFSQFARMPQPRTSPTDLHQLVDGTLTLYDGLFADVTFERRYAEGLPPVRLDPEQIRRVVINVIDNAIEAMDRRGRITLETGVDSPNHLVRLVIADNGPGIPPGDREKLFLPYYSTKRRGSGLGLAIVRRIIAEHGGTIDASDNLMTIYPGLPANTMQEFIALAKAKPGQLNYATSTSSTTSLACGVHSAECSVTRGTASMRWRQAKRAWTVWRVRLWTSSCWMSGCLAWTASRPCRSCASGRWTRRSC